MYNVLVVEEHYSTRLENEMSVMIFAEEGEKVVVLTDISSDITQDELYELYKSKLTSDQYDVFCDQVDEGVLVSELTDLLSDIENPNDINQLKEAGFVVVKRTLDKYIRDFVKWYDESGFEE